MLFTFAILLSPPAANWILARRWRRWRQMNLNKIFIVFWLMALAPVCTQTTVYLTEYVLKSQPQALALNDAPISKIYRSQTRVTQAALHGLDGWKGVDVKAGCGATIYAPFTGTITHNGLDGYNHVDSRGVVYDQSTMIIIEGDGLEMTLLHGDYTPSAGSEVQQGQPIGKEASHGWSTGCHSHIILKVNGRTVNYLEFMSNNIYQGNLSQDTPLKISWYDPALGGINCAEPCDTMATDTKVTEARYGRTAACIAEWTAERRIVVIPGLGEFECLDRGGAIVQKNGYIWIDLLLHEPLVPFGTLIDDWYLK